MSAPVQYVSLQDALAMHALSIKRYGGAEGTRDEGLLESALAQPAQTFDDVELYPSLAEKAARVRFKPRLTDMQNVIIAIADGTMSYDELVVWIEEQI